jgi:hypothetical protein
LDSNSRQHWNEAPDKLQVGTESNPQVRKPKTSDGDLQLHQYKRGQVDALFVEFRKWLEASVDENQRVVPMCDKAQDDDTKLWIDPTVPKKEVVETNQEEVLLDSQ